MNNSHLLIALLLCLALILTFFFPPVPALADPGVPVPWEVNCNNVADVDGFIDRGFCVPGVVLWATYFTRSPSRFYGVGSSYAPGIMEYMCERNGGCAGFKDGVALMSCGDIGRTVWIKVSDNRPWYGPLKAVDCSQAFHSYVNVVEYNLSIELGAKTAEHLGLRTMESVGIALGAKPRDVWWGVSYQVWWIENALEFRFTVGINWELRFYYYWLCETQDICRLLG